MLTGFENRIDYIDWTDLSKPSTFNKILQGSHVLIDEDFEFDLCEMNKDAGYTVANLNDFGHSRYSVVIPQL